MVDIANPSSQKRNKDMSRRNVWTGRDNMLQKKEINGILGARVLSTTNEEAAFCAVFFFFAMSFRVPRLACLLAHLADGLLDVGKKIEYMAIGINLDRLDVTSVDPGRTVYFDRASWWGCFIDVA